MPKSCSKKDCQSTPETISFSKNSLKKDGLDTVCKTCRKTAKGIRDARRKARRALSAKWKDLTPATLIRAKSQARYVARSMGFQNLEDDLFQEYCISLSRGRKSTCRQVMIDMLRSLHGREDTSLRRRSNHMGMMLLKEHIVEGEQEACDYDDFLKSILTKRDTERERVMFLLYIKYNFNMKDIADCFGLSESRVTLIFAPLFARMKHRIGKES